MNPLYLEFGRNTKCFSSCKYRRACATMPFQASAGASAQPGLRLEQQLGLCKGGRRLCRASSSACAQAVGLAEKRDCCAAALSGGMKRKLQVALALLGDSRVVLLGGAPTLTTTL